MEVKDKKRGRPVLNENRLESSSIITTAKSLILEERKVPSIRKLASKLKVDPMAIYHYFPNKNALLEAVTKALIDEIYIPEPNLGWRENLQNLCLSYLELLLHYPGLLQIILTASAEGPAGVFQKRFEKAVKKLSLPEETRRTVQNLLVDYIHGFALASDCSGKEIPANLTAGPFSFIFDALNPLSK